jgi:hypothetical protein
MPSGDLQLLVQYEESFARPMLEYNKANINYILGFLGGLLLHALGDCHPEPLLMHAQSNMALVLTGRSTLQQLMHLALKIPQDHIVAKP